MFIKFSESGIENLDQESWKNEPFRMVNIEEESIYIDLLLFVNRLAIINFSVKC